MLRTLFLWVALALPVSAQTPDLGYVVRAEGGSVYLDLGESAGAKAGQRFVVFKEGEELKHPVTGRSLGTAEVKVAEGVISQVEPLFSVGTLDGAASVERGQRARLVAPAAAPAVQAPPPSAPALPSGEPGSRGPRWRSDAFAFEAAGMSLADFDGDGKLETAVGEGQRVLRYAYPPKPGQPLSERALTGNALRLLSLEAADLNGNGKAELFVTIFNDTFARFETLVFELDPQGQWAPAAEIPGVVRSIQEGQGKRVLATQRVVDDKTFPYSTIYPLVFEDGKYAAGKPAIRPKRVDWVHDFTFANLDGTEPAVLSLTSSEVLRVQFKKGQWKSAEAYGQTPLRVRWTNRVLSFRPPMVVRYEGGRFGGLYLIKNIAALGGLAQPFGLFTRGSLVRKDWDGVALSDAWQAPLGGYAVSAALVPASEGRPEELAVMVVGTTGKSAVWTFDP